MSGQGPDQGYTWTSNGYDSLDPYMNGEWHFEIDPELLEYVQGFEDNGSGTRADYGNQTGTATAWGFSTPDGTIIPIFREWYESTPIPANPNDPNDLPGFEVILRREFMGFQDSRTYQVASLNQDIWSLWQRGETFLDLFNVGEAFEDFQNALTGVANTSAMSGTPTLNAAGDLQVAVQTDDGEFLGHVVVTDEGFTFYDRQGRESEFIRPLTQHWNTIE